MSMCVVLPIGATRLVANTTFGQGDGPIVANVACNGTEDQLMDCLFNITHGCVHGNDMALRCTATSTGKSILQIVQGTYYPYNLGMQPIEAS